ECHPRAVHRIGDLLWRIGSRKRLTLFVVEVIEDKSDFKAMTRTETTSKLWRTPGKLIHICAPRIMRVSLGQANGRYAEKPVGDNGFEQITCTGIGAYCPVSSQCIRDR